MGNVLQDKLQDHWSTLEQFYTAFYNTMTQMPCDFWPKQLKLKTSEEQGRFEHISLEVQMRSLHAG